MTQILFIKNWERKTFYVFILGIICSLLLLFGFLMFVVTRVAMPQSCQSENIGVRYNSYKLYCFSIVKERRLLQVDYIVWISEKNKPNTGFYFRFPSWEGFGEPDLRSMKVSWLAEGVEFSFDGGFRIFVPKNIFLSGNDSFALPPANK